jgi:hypothetical protein
MEHPPLEVVGARRGGGRHREVEGHALAGRHGRRR